MKIILLTTILAGWAGLSFAQTWPLTGNVFSEDYSPLVYSTVVLLNPADSTMQFYGITNPEGKFDIKNIRKGDYLLQVAFLGYETYYKTVSIPVEGNNLGQLTMKPKPLSVSEVSVMGEYVPLSFRGDTTVYNAAAFQLKPGAVAEDLLKKLPGVEVDRAGNIKAMGEDVRRVMVDGKEFFGNDPKVATKNVPADAVDKVQIYDRTSEESMFTGIHDGSRDKTIKLWEVATGRELRTLTGHSWSVSALAFAPDARSLASGSGDNTVRVWDVTTGQVVRTIRRDNPRPLKIK